MSIFGLVVGKRALRW